MENTTGKDFMAKPSHHVLTWSEEHQYYELHTQGHLQQRFGLDDEQMWQDWLSQHTSFAFQRQHRHVSVIKEARSRGAGYWYAYSTLHGRTRKRYLGQTSSVTLKRLQHEALTFANENNATSQKMRQGTQVFTDTLPMMDESHISLLGTKHTLPRLPSAFVRRERLLKKLNEVLKHRLLILSSSAGSGKTTLLSAWAAQSPQLVGWLSLDELDNDPTRFWASVITVLRTCLPEISDLTQSMLYAPQPVPLSTILTTLINELLRCSSDMILILDDYHVIEDQTIQDAMLFLLDHLPSNLHLIISGRVDPPLPLSRWRMRGQMIELREEDLCFRYEEASRFLRQGMELSLSEEEVKLLEGRTEGWIAGLQLAALSLRTQKNPSAFVQHFSGGQRFILDYMLEEIFQQQPFSVQRFLLQISVLSQMNAALCQAVTEEPASQELLEMLERSNLFVVPLDDQRQWYRLHTLFREVLQARLQATQPELIPRLHQRAAHWYEAQNSIYEAIAHALAAKDYPLAMSVMERAAGQLWMSVDAKTISRWVLLLPDVVLRKHLGFALTATLNLLSSAQSLPEQRAQAQAQSEQIIARVEQALQSEREVWLSQAEEQGLHKRIGLLRKFVVMSEAFRKGDMQQVRQIAQEMQPLATNEVVAWKWPSLYGLFVSAQFLGDAVLLLPELLAMKRQAIQEQDRAIALVVMCWIAAAFLYEGNLRLLQQECLQVQDLLAQAGEQVSIAAYPAFDLSFLYYEWNQLEQAESSLQVAIQQASRWQDMNLLVWSHATYVKVLLASGKMAEAEETLQQAQKLMQQSGFTVHAPEVMAAQVSLWLARGDLSTAEAWAAHYVFDPQGQDCLHEEEYLALARVYLKQQQYEQCLHLIAPLLNRMERFERTWDVIHLLALQAVALYGPGEAVQAQQVIVRLLDLTESEGYIRVYLDAGEPMRHLLQSLRETPYKHEGKLSAASLSYISTLLAAFDQEEHKRNGRVDSSRVGTDEPSLQSMPAVQGGPYEPLSPQEQRVLSLLVAGRTYGEIAQELIVSPNTIKTQISSIYRKLGVSRRAEASAVAQHLQLL